MTLVTTGSFVASADQATDLRSGTARDIVRVADHYYGNDGYDCNGCYDDDDDRRNRTPYRSGHGWREGNWRNDGYDDNNQVVSPRWIMRQWRRSDYRHVSRPVLSGHFYQVKAVNPDGRKAKLSIDAYDGRIVRWKYRS
jgi:hypothetical protein